MMYSQMQTKPQLSLNFNTGEYCKKNRLSQGLKLCLKKKVFDWRNPTDPHYPAAPRYLN